MCKVEKIYYKECGHIRVSRDDCDKKGNFLHFAQQESLTCEGECLTCIGKKIGTGLLVGLVKSIFTPEK
jgi:hypothetical protein